MNKQEIQKRILQNGSPLPLDKFEWNEEAKVFSTTENYLVLDFKGIDSVTFNTGSNCTFKTSSTGSNCTFNTGYACVVVRRDVYEVIELTENQKIKLNPFGIKGFEILNDKPKETIKIGNNTYDKAEVEEALKNVKSI